MKTPRDISGNDLILYLSSIGYIFIRQKGSHYRMEFKSAEGTFRLTVPIHNPIKIGTLNSTLRDVSAHTGKNYFQILEELNNY